MPHDGSTSRQTAAAGFGDEAGQVAQGRQQPAESPVHEAEQNNDHRSRYQAALLQRLTMKNHQLPGGIADSYGADRRVWLVWVLLFDPDRAAGQYVGGRVQLQDAGKIRLRDRSGIWRRNGARESRPP